MVGRANDRQVRSQTRAQSGVEVGGAQFQQRCAQRFLELLDAPRDR